MHNNFVVDSTFNRLYSSRIDYEITAWETKTNLMICLLIKRF